VSDKGRRIMQCLANKHILVGVTGSVAAYKSAELVRRLREAGAVVRVAMTANAKRFITPLTMQAVSGYPVHEDLFDLHAEAAMGHIELARWAEAILIAPASADFMARLATGVADDLLTTLCLATRAPIAVAPAMNQGMWQDRLTQDNLQALTQKGIYFFGPGEGSQACGDVGPGRMLEPTDLVTQLGTLFQTGLLVGLKVVITAGPTQEAIDPVRFISNHSSGKMGYAMATAACEAGAKVTLISGPVSLPALADVETIAVVSAKEMHAAVMRKMPDCDIFLAVAAVGDYGLATIPTKKIHKSSAVLNLVLTPNPDIVADVGQLPRKPFIVGFAAETDDVIQQAKAKLKHKNMDMIIANQVGEGLAMGSDDNEVTVIHADDNILKLPRMLKSQLARQLITLIAKTFQARQP